MGCNFSNNEFNDNFVDIISMVNENFENYKFETLDDLFSFNKKWFNLAKKLDVINPKKDEIFPNCIEKEFFLSKYQLSNIDELEEEQYNLNEILDKLKYNLSKLFLLIIRLM